ncbi:MAG: hypothetical protein A3J65_00520 [Candidatus Buchananbacteria bacterium RIFCSPHIGHO2_02_FULL_45_11b]|uniref:HYDIN/VesB/CFA65-like Ig-like domain-containing protein n=4 Tax=Candidatus Buchananiibacteriota TaxID=1817903 RepID=A0A1G1YBT5_9BACT|nr:MAG: hypothetical protein A2663_01085 [Candidatus Buchananbacteria bacterium RIFCSPHIGHO2_01_FULL_46_12]OGY49812.1 MAG: hypothetical protein A3J65_00520 [Candidatus Buchananbacteria bacterium RIFCSPHIGHO2_02_FULL_45_11b]OGY53600.1 MAG: hypothetical protein A3B15_03440 [Candidatus Buchananbacteria bacterium RIFCSPLOWO2_01_FULL_45_31]OGY57355.1 MAG: hypothetical protein A3H67_04420 [Candidatus Buchananbacteria bacterium RIFCSPLOWO2_02_FULL_46_11b]
MSKKNDPRLIILAAAAAAVIFGGIILGVAMSSGGGQGDNGGAAKLSADSYQYDFGAISMANGLVKHIFTISNAGTADLKLSNISTSCMCTTAVLEINGQRSPEFGMHSNPAFWSGELKPGQTANLEITFDPLAHGPDATGPITRTVTLSSNDGGRSNVKSNFTFTGNVVK